jgi:acrylyl-CoA reductase (NADPH)
VALLAKLGFEVAASTGRPEEADYLKSLGAKDILARTDFSGSPRPLSKERWAGAIDVAGGSTLANVISQLRYGGAVAACGLAQSMDLPASVAPFILRGVSLIGIDSVMAPEVMRIAAWDRLTRDLDPATLDRLTVRKALAEVVELAPQILEGKIRGRVVLDVG